MTPAQQVHEEPTFSIGTPRVSGTSRAVKMSAMVCQTPKKTNTPYFIVHIIMRKTCRTIANSFGLKIFNHLNEMFEYDYGAAVSYILTLAACKEGFCCPNDSHLCDDGSRQKLCEDSDGLPRRAGVEVMHFTGDQPPCMQHVILPADGLHTITDTRL